MNTIRFEKDSNNIVHLVLDKPDSSANLMDQAFAADFAAVTKRLGSETFDGVIVRSEKSTFFSGGDLQMLANITEDNAQLAYDMVESIKASMRVLEKSIKPVVACINGAALGGGWELALACNHRIALNNKKVKLGLPEVTLGLLPGAGGVNRMTRMLGIQAAMPYLVEGKQFLPIQGQKVGLINEVVETPEQMLENAVAWIKANPEVQQPWDQKGFKIPGGSPSHPAIAQKLPVLPSMIRQKTRGNFPAPEAIVSAMIEGAQVDFDTATRIESRYLVELACSAVTKNTINTFWFQLNEIKSGVGRPDGVAPEKVTKVGVLGAGMMGAGIAYSCAVRGIEVVLKDVTQQNAEKGKAYSQGILDKQVAKGRKTQEQADEILALITPTEATSELQGCDLVIEAVFEDRNLKALVTQEAEAAIGTDSVFASNTSTLPITGLAEASSRPAKFAGLHFFSPVDKMPLVEIICGEKTSPATLAACYDFVLQIGKTPIVVNDSRGFYTSRVFETFVCEGIAMLGEGVASATVENAGYLSGFPVGPLAVTDEVALSLIDKIKQQTIKDYEAEGKTYTPHPADKVIDRMLELERHGKAAGAGFYEYPQQGNKHLWPGLDKHFAVEGASGISLQDAKDRLLFVMALETVRCMEENVLTSSRDANIGSIFGIGYPAWTGGTVQFINQYGLEAFINRANELADKYGERFRVPQLIKDKAQAGELL